MQNQSMQKSSIATSEEGGTTRLNPVPIKVFSKRKGTPGIINKNRSRRAGSPSPIKRPY